jgi:hypothetical protein
LNPPDPQLTGACLIPTRFQPFCTYQVKKRFQNVPFKTQLCTATRRKQDAVKVGAELAAAQKERDDATLLVDAVGRCTLNQVDP